MESTPVFVRIEQHQELTKALGAVDQKLKEASTLLEQLERLKEEEDAQIKAWGASLADVKSRAEDLHKALHAISE